MRPISLIPAVAVENLNVSFNGRVVLEDITFQIPKGEVVALIGPNGSGKTTLLRCLLGLLKPDSGKVSLFGTEDLREALPLVGYNPQRLEPRRDCRLSVEELLASRENGLSFWLGRYKLNLSGGNGNLLERLKIGPFLKAPLAQLSGGQLQRVMLAYMLLGNPELVLLDEPTANVDQPGEQSFYDWVGEIRAERHCTVVLVSHDLSMVYKHATHVFAINRTLCCSGTPEHVMNSDTLKAAFGVDTTAYSHHHGHHHH